MKLSWILSQHGSSRLWMHVAIALLVFCGSFTEWISRFFWIGSFLASKTLLDINFNKEDWLRPDIATDLGLATNPNGDGLGWRTLELNHFVVTGFVWFVDAFEWVCL